MKIMTYFLILLISSYAIVCYRLPTTPKANDLSDHFGTEPVANKFGPKTPPTINLQREGAIPGSHVTPIPNYTTEINDKHVVSGDLTNTAFDAGKILIPEYASKIFIYNFYRTQSRNYC